MFNKKSAIFTRGNVCGTSYITYITLIFRMTLHELAFKEVKIRAYSITTYFLIALRSTDKK